MLAQTINTNVDVIWKWISLQHNNNDGELKVAIIYKAFDSNNKPIPTIQDKTIVKDGANYNIFWENYNSGAYLYEVLKAELGSSVSIPASVENEFLNP